MVSYESFTNYYGGINTVKMALEYAEREQDIEYKEMFLKLAAELKLGIRYISYINANGQLAYKKAQ